MAPAEPVNFNDIIQADRQKRKHEELASQLLGKARKPSAPASGSRVGKKAQTQNATPGSLASRIGVTKRSASANLAPKKQNQAHSAPTRSKSAQFKPTNKRHDEERLTKALNATNGRAMVRNNPAGMSIKGTSSGPFTVVGSNFAPGTTAADIQSALEPMVGAPVLSCVVTSHRPAVTAEIVFEERWPAENVIANFHNQRADGRVLSMRFKDVGASNNSAFNTQSASNFSASQMSFNDLRAEADRQRRANRANPAVQDGSYGFGEQSYQPQPLGRDERGNSGYNNQRYNQRQNNSGNNSRGRDFRQAQQSSLYSDEMMIDAPQTSRNRGRR